MTSRAVSWASCSAAIVHLAMPGMNIALGGELCTGTAAGIPTAASTWCWSPSNAVVGRGLPTPYTTQKKRAAALLQAAMVGRGRQAHSGKNRKISEPSRKAPTRWASLRPCRSRAGGPASGTVRGGHANALVQASERRACLARRTPAAQQLAQHQLLPMVPRGRQIRCGLYAPARPVTGSGTTGK